MDFKSFAAIEAELLAYGVTVRPRDPTEWRPRYPLWQTATQT